MDSLNNIFKNNIFTSYPNSFEFKTKSTTKKCKDIFATNQNEIDKEISMYLDILYKNSDEELINKTDKLKLNSAYLPKNQKTIYFGDIYL